MKNESGGTTLLMPTLNIAGVCYEPVLKPGPHPNCRIKRILRLLISSSPSRTASSPLHSNNFELLADLSQRLCDKMTSSFTKACLGTVLTSLAPHKQSSFGLRSEEVCPRCKQGEERLSHSRTSLLKISGFPTSVNLKQERFVHRRHCCTSAYNHFPIEATQLPSLQRLETAFRATTPGKSIGLDPIPAEVFHTGAPQLARRFYSLLLKTYLWAEEPVQYKGGKMVMLYKKGSSADVANYRGIVLLATASKRFHAILRQDLEQLMSHLRPQGQLGGFGGQQTSFGAQALRLFGNVARSANKSSFVLFIDIQNAGHRLPRELMMGVLHQRDWDNVLTALQAAENPMEAYAAGQSFVSVLDKLNAPALLTRALRSAHANTWFTLTGSEIVRTARGTRPGSPIADIIFHLVMFDAMAELDAWIQQRQPFKQLQEALGIAYTTITTRTAAELCSW